MGSKRRRNKHTREKSVYFQLMGAELAALQKAVWGYSHLVEMMPIDEARQVVLDILYSLADHLSDAVRQLVSEKEMEPFLFPGLEVGVANDAVLTYLVAANLLSEIALVIAPIEDRAITATLVPLQKRLQYVVNQISPEGIRGCLL